MQGKIALEEHFAIPETLADSRGYFPDRVWQELKSRVLDLHERRLKLMDEHGIEMMIAVAQRAGRAGDPRSRSAHEMARRANDFLAEQVAKRPGPFPGPRRAARCRTPRSRRASSSAASRSSASAARW